MFTGKGVQQLIVEDKDGTITETSQDTEFTSLILPIGEEPSDIFERLDVCVLHDILDYKSEKGLAKANSCLWYTFNSPAAFIYFRLKELPAMLMLQESVSLCVFYVLNPCSVYNST